MHMKFWTGCSGWQYAEWRELFYPKDLPQLQWLSFYAERFNTVEINSTFYHMPTAKTMQRWKELAPKNFCYSIKANRAITHYSKFHHTQEIIQQLYSLTDILAEHLGCILFQLPGSIHYDADLLEDMLKQFSPHKKNIIEFRHASWWRDEVREKLATKNIIFANIDSPSAHFPFYPTGEISYLRLHGHKKWYQEEYGEKILLTWLHAIKKSKAKEVWCYFDNTADGAALADAYTWQKIVSKAHTKSGSIG